MTKEWETIHLSLALRETVQRGKTIDRVIRHLELAFEAERPAPLRVLQQELLMAAEESRESLTSPFWM
jgi:hypothetical protein